LRTLEARSGDKVATDGQDTTVQKNPRSLQSELKRMCMVEIISKFEINYFKKNIILNYGNAHISNGYHGNGTVTETRILEHD
jgi:hypothetical protein